MILLADVILPQELVDKIANTTPSAEAAYVASAYFGVLLLLVAMVRWAGKKGWLSFGR